MAAILHWHQSLETKKHARLPALSTSICPFGCAGEAVPIAASVLRCFSVRVIGVILALLVIGGLTVHQCTGGLLDSDPAGLAFLLTFWTLHTGAFSLFQKLYGQASKNILACHRAQPSSNT